MMASFKLTRDDGKTWNKVTPKGFPNGPYQLIEPSRSNRPPPTPPSTPTKLMTSNPYIFKTSDFARPGRLSPPDFPTAPTFTPVREDPKRKRCSMPPRRPARGFPLMMEAHWQVLPANLATTPVHDLIIHGDDLVVAHAWPCVLGARRHRPLRQRERLHRRRRRTLFTSRAAVRTPHGACQRRRYAIGENPPDGAALFYYLKEEPKEHIKLELLEHSGKVIRAFTSEERKKTVPPTNGKRRRQVGAHPAKAWIRTNSLGSGA